MTGLSHDPAEVWDLYRSDPASLGTIVSRIHVWRIALDSMAEPVGENLSAEEVARAERLRRLDDRRRFVVTRSVLRCILADVRGASDDPKGAALRLGHGAAGKPFLVDDPRLHFNVSHSDDLALIAVTRVGDVGVDVERQRAVADCDDVARLVFGEAERSALLASPEEERDDLFYRFWTRKEALLKAMGVGFSTLDDADAAFPAPAETAWLVTSLPRLDGYAAALARPRHARGVRLWSWPNAAALPPA